MKTLVYSKRNFKELLNDPINLAFTIGLPVFLIIFMVIFNKSLQINESFNVENFVPSTIIFSFTFLTMFAGMLIAKDRTSEFLSRMYVSPLKAHNYILGYVFPMLVIAFAQILILYSIGFALGLKFTINILASIPFLLLISLIFIGLGLVFGSLLRDSVVGGVSSIIIQVVAFTSGMWFSLELIGGAFKVISYILPFSHSVDLVKNIVSGNYDNTLVSFLVVAAYTLIMVILSIVIFKKKMKQ